MALALLPVNAAKAETVTVEITDTLTAESFAATDSSYTSFSGVAGDSGAVYAGNSAKTSDGDIMLRSRNGSSGIITTASGGKVRSITIDVAHGSNDILVYGSNTPYTDTLNLYSPENQGTALGCVSGVDTTITVDEDYGYIGLCSREGTVYMTSISIVWEVEVEVPPPAIHTVTVINGTGGGEYEVGASVTVTAVAPEENMWFFEWMCSEDLNITEGDILMEHLTFIMPDYDVTLEADFDYITNYLTVNNGTGSGSYKIGESVTITANAPPEGRVFRKWTGTDGLTFTEGDASTATATFLMPNYDLTVTAVFGNIEIDTYEKLKAFAERVNNGETSLCAELTADIVATDTDFTPISCSDEYKGVFDGHGHTIEGLRISCDTVSVGLFSYVGRSGVVKNVELKDASIFGAAYYGGIAGCNAGVVQDCCVIGTVSGSSAYGGGIVGFNTGTGTVQRCYYACETPHSIDGGGVAGCNDGTVQYCYYDSDTVSALRAIWLDDGTATNVSGLSTAQMTGEAASENMEGFEFGTVWFTTASYPALQMHFIVTVNHGTGSGEYAVGKPVTITANVPESDVVFLGWDGADGLTFIEGGASTLTATFVMPASDVTVTATFEKGNPPKFTTHSLTLDGSIGVNFFMKLSELAGVDYTESYMTFEISGKGTVSADPVPFSAEHMNANGTYYGFTCRVNPIQMADTITATFHYGNHKTVSQTYSINQYIQVFDWYIEEHPEDYDDKTIDLVHALADYGHYVQLFLSEAKGLPLGGGDDAYMPMELCYTAAEDYDTETIAEQLSDCAVSAINLDPNIRSLSYTVVLESATTIRMIVRPVSGYTGVLHVGSGNDTVTIPLQSGRWTVEFANIPAHLLGEGHGILMWTDHASGGSPIEIAGIGNLSVMTYAKQLLNGSDAARNAGAALYAYWQAAKAFKEAN